MSKRQGFILAESLCALMIIAIGFLSFNLTFQQFVLKLRSQRQATDQAQVLQTAARQIHHGSQLAPLQVNQHVYQIKTGSDKLSIGQGDHYAEITW